MKKNTLLVFGLVAQIGLYSCQEVYNDRSVKTNSEILVVQGLISDADGPYSVRLSKALPFNDTEFSSISEELAVTGAEVIIRDDTGDFELLSETPRDIISLRPLALKERPAGHIRYTFVLRKGIFINPNHAC